MKATLLFSILAAICSSAQAKGATFTSVLAYSDPLTNPSSKLNEPNSELQLDYFEFTVRLDELRENFKCWTTSMDPNGDADEPAEGHCKPLDNTQSVLDFQLIRPFPIARRLHNGYYAKLEGSFSVDFFHTAESDDKKDEIAVEIPAIHLTQTGNANIFSTEDEIHEEA